MDGLYIFIAAFAYALVRYVVFGNVSLSHSPLFIADKAVAVTALVSLLQAVTSGDREIRRRSAKRGLALSGLHLFAVLPILTPAYFPSWFAEDGTFAWRAELTLLFGVSALMLVVGLCWPRAPVVSEATRADDGSMDPRTWRKLAVGLSVAHVAVMGAHKWFDVAAWPGRLPPITLVCVLLAMGMCGGAILRKRATLTGARSRRIHSSPVLGLSGRVAER